MYLEEFHKWVDEIDILQMNEQEHENKIIQLFDLRHFIECYKPSLTVIDCLQHSVNIVEDEGVRKGIVFIDFYETPKNVLFEMMNKNHELALFKKQEQLEELWLVFVKEQSDLDNDAIIRLAQQHQLRDYYQRIFIFHFFPSLIHELN